jgi:hypothetical protein
MCSKRCCNGSNRSQLRFRLNLYLSVQRGDSMLLSLASKVLH